MEHVILQLSAVMDVILNVDTAEDLESVGVVSVGQDLNVINASHTPAAIQSMEDVGVLGNAYANLGGVECFAMKV